MNLIKYLSLSAFCASLVGCASFDAKTHQEYNFVSKNVPAVKVTINGAITKETPTSLIAERGKTYTLQFSKEGYESYQRKLTANKNPKAPARVTYEINDLKPIPGYKAPKAEPKPVQAPASAPAPKAEPKKVAPAPAPVPAPAPKVEPKKVAPAPAPAPAPKAEPKKVVIPDATLSDLKKELATLKKERQLNLISQKEFEAKAAKIAEKIKLIYE